MQDVRWKKPSRSGPNGNCIQLANTRDMIRDSKDPHGTVLRIGRDEFDRFVAAVKDGRFGR